MKTMLTSVLIFFFIAICFNVNSQNTVYDVLNNNVNPNTKVIGTIDTVSTLAELKSTLVYAMANGNCTILIEDGTYAIASTSWYPYITTSNIVIRSLSGNRDNVIITGQGMRATSSTEDGFYFVGNNVTIADLTIKEVANHGIQMQGDSILVHNVKLQDTYEQMLKGVSADEGADDVTVEYCLFEYTAGVGPNYYIGGIDFHCSQNCLIHDNVFRNIISPSGSVAEHAIHFWNSSSDNTIERNLIINCDRGIGFGLGTSANNGGIIRNNTIYNDGTATYADVGIGLETSPNTKVYNNTIYLATYANAIEYRYSATTGVEITNNLTNAVIKSRDGGSATLATNITNAEASWFKDVSEGDLRLNSAIASVVDQGTTLLSVEDDIERESRPIGAGCDIGADEYNVSSAVVDLSENDVSIYPNPTKDKITIKANGVELVEIENANGGVVKTISINTNQVEIDLSNLPKGIYLVKVTTSNQIIVKKIILK
jgi:hypothetical protein